MAQSFLEVEDIFVSTNGFVPEKLEVGSVAFFTEGFG